MLFLTQLKQIITDYLITPTFLTSFFYRKHNLLLILKVLYLY